MYFFSKLVILIVSVVSMMGSVEAKEVTFEEVLVGLESNSLIYLDVRNRDEVRTDGKVVGSLIVPLPELEKAFQLQDEEFFAAYGFSKPAQNATNVVIACRSGRRAVTAIETLKKLGYNSLNIYKGSFLDWQARGGPIVKEK